MPPNGIYPGYPKQRRLNMLLIPFIITVLSLLGVLVFAIWAFAGMQDYKGNVDKKVDAALIIARDKISSEKDKEFAEKEKSPLKSYKGSATYGSVNFQYPKTWSAYVVEQGSGGQPIDGYLHPDFVPGVQSATTFALRFQVSQQSYANEVQGLESVAASGKISITPFRADKVNSILGIRVEGEVFTGHKDTMVVLPLRDKTLKIWTESPQFAPDFNATILPSLSFVP